MPSPRAGAPRTRSGPLHPAYPRVVAARRLQRRRDRDAAGRFLAEGPQAVREALAARAWSSNCSARPQPSTGTPSWPPRGPRRRAGLRGRPTTRSPRWPRPSPRRAWSPSAAHLDVPLDDACADGPRLVAVLAEIRDPGNAGTVLRTADAAGAAAVVFAGDARRPVQRQVRAGLGRQPLPRRRGPRAATRPGRRRRAARRRAARCSPPTGYGADDLDDLADDGRLAAPTAWLFGSEAHGLPGGAGRRRRRPGPGAAARARREPEPGCGRRRVPVRFGESTASGREPGRQCRPQGSVRS